MKEISVSTAIGLSDRQALRVRILRHNQCLGELLEALIVECFVVIIHVFAPKVFIAANGLETCQ